MLILKQIAFITTQIFLCTVCFAQREKIDSLKKALPSLKDSARVDCLNELSGIYLKSYNDTARYYSAEAYEEASKVNYIHGIAEAQSCKGDAELNIEEDFQASEKLSREAIEWYRKTPNKKRLAETYFNLGGVLYAQSFFSEAIKNLDTAYRLFKLNGDRLGISWSIFILGHVYDESGNYEKAFELDRKGLDIAIRNNDDEFRRAELTHMAMLFKQIGDYKTALEYLRQAYENVKPYPLDFAELFTLQQQYDSAKYYYSIADTSDQREIRFYLASIGEYYFAQTQFDKALQNFMRSLEYNKQKNDRNQVMHLSMDIAKTYLALQNNTAAFEYARQGLNLAKQTGAKQFIRDGNQILYSLYDASREADSANHYYRQYIVMKDSILNDQVKAKLIAYGPEQKIELLNKEKEVQKVQLQKQSLLRNILISSIIVLLLLTTIIVRNVILKRKNEKLQLENELKEQQIASERIEAELKQQTTELEMQALRAQMNPHFIFNSLNSINRFILQNDKAKASEYLTKFSRLVRLILQNSATSLIPLESELESLRLYLELEAVRFNHHFDYKIIIDEDLDIDILKVPPLIIQPYAENAIWHGLMHKEEKGHLEIDLYLCDELLCCKITDDGIGRERAAELKSKSASTHKSMGMRITADRIAMLQQKKQINTTIKITDLVLPDGSAGGTKVLLKIPVMI
ncbi:MAG: tetratricopeptide repeat protein [Segetibacter sp.]